MRRYAALLRALNVGGHTVTMARLRELFEQAGLSGVETVIASGNVIFGTSARAVAPLERRIERHLHEALGYAVATFIRTPDELARVVRARPFKPSAVAESGTRVFVAFLGREPTTRRRQDALALRTGTDDLVVDGREIYWLCRVPANEASVSGAMLEKALDLPVTVRNITTVRKLAARVSSG